MAISSRSCPGSRALDCGGAIALSHGVSVDGTTVGGTNNQTEYCGWGAGYPWSGPEDVYTFTTADVSDLRITLTNFGWNGNYGDLDLFILGSCDATDCWNWGDETVFYPDAPAGTYYIVVEGWNGAEADYTITAWSSAGILLVDDDHSGWPGSPTGYADVSGVYTTALTSIGKPADSTWNVDFLGSPALADLMTYKQVVWVTGEDDRAGLILSGAEEGALAGFLDAGGMLLLTSQGYLRDLTSGVDGLLDEGAFAFNYLQVKSVTNDLSGHETPMTGMNGDPIGDDGNLGTGTNALTVSTSSPVANASTGMDTIYGHPVYRTDHGIPAVLRYDNYVALDFYRVVFASFPPENITSSSPDDLDTFLDRSLTWMNQFHYPDILTGVGFYDDVTGNGNFIPDPGETVELEFIVQNDDTKDCTAEAYLVIHDAYVTPVIDKLDLGTVTQGGGQASGRFRVTLDAGTPIGHRIEFSVNLWIDGTWYDTPGYGCFVGQADTLLVKDEELYPNTSGIAPYESALQNMGITYALHDNAKFESPLYDDADLMSNLLMKSYNHIIWMTGQDWAYTVRIEDETELAELLDAGGRLLLVSQDYFWDVFGGDSCNPACTLSSGDFGYDYLGVQTVNQDVVSKGDSTVAGVTTEDLSKDLSLTLQHGCTIGNEADAITALSPLGARSLFVFPGDQTTGLIYEGKSTANLSVYRYISLWFPYENLLEYSWPNSPLLLMRRIYYWFDYGDTTTNTLGLGTTYYYPVDPSPLKWDPSQSRWTWTGVTTNTNGETIEIHYHIHWGLDAAALEKYPYEYEVNWADDPIPDQDPGVCVYYRVKSVDLLEIESQ